MATIELKNPRFLPWLNTLARRLSDAQQRHRRYRRTLEELRMLNDRDLADLGIARADFQALAREAIASADD